MRKTFAALSLVLALAPSAVLAQAFGYGAPGTLNQGTPGSTAWPFNLYVGGAVNSLANPAFLQVTPGAAYVGQVGPSVTVNTGGVSSASRLPSSTATTNLTQAKSGAGRLYKVVACNTSTTSARIKFYDSLSANVTVGTTVPKFTRPLPPAAAAGGLACASYDWADLGFTFTTGLSWALTTGAADTDATAVAAGAVTDVSVEYQ